MQNALRSNGSVAIWFNKEINSGIFDRGKNFIWKRFELLGKECSIISEGNKVSAVIELGSVKEKTIISTIVRKSKTNNLNSLLLKWTNSVVSLYIDNEYLKEVNMQI